jgi:murein L,D-transpeptidase YcbB/YkuD
MSGDETPLRTDNDDWFGESRAARASSSPDDWIAAGPARDPRRDLGRPARDRLSRRATIVTVVALVVLVAAGVVLAFVFTGGEKKQATPPATLPTTTHETTTTKKPPTGKTPAAPTVTLKPGDTGAQVKRLQRFLRLFGYSTSPVDGDYGPATTAAVKRFQQATNLTADGIAGPATLKAIKAALGSKR